MQSSAVTVREYLNGLPKDRRNIVEKVRKTILGNLPAGYEEGVQYGMLSYYIPLERYPDTYNGQALSIVALASQKNYFSVYLMSIYGDPKHEAWFKEAYKKSGKKLDMGKSCVRFRKLEDLPLEVIGEAVSLVTPEDYIAHYEKTRVLK